MRDFLRRLLLRLPPTAWLIRRRQHLVRLRGFRRDFDAFAGRHDPSRLPLRWEDRHPCLDDATPAYGLRRPLRFSHRLGRPLRGATSSRASCRYLFEPLFFGLVSAFVPVSFYDFRPADLRLPGLETARADLLALPFADRSIASLSCLHVVEHIGLGRYGEPLDPESDLRALRELERVLAPGGTLLLVVPVGRPRVVFNAHRIYTHAQITAALPALQLAEFALVPDFPRIELLRDASPALADSQEYGCGCFRFTRPTGAACETK